MIESGENFGKYTLLERLAVGGMAEIFRASAGGFDGFEKIVAIKRLHKQYSEDSDFATMLIDEAKLAVQLNHSNIGQVFDLGCIDGQYFIVMEFINGLDLQELADRVRSQNRVMPLEAVIHIAIRVAEALHYAHQKLGPDGKPLEVVHRDVSPQNVMLSIDGEVKLVDFGIAKARMRAQHTRAGIIKGKFYYMSPEQALGHRIDGRTDVYALGMVLYEILSGQHPFDQIPDSDLLKAVRMADYAPISHVLPDLPGPVLEVIEGALMRDVERRYSSALDLMRDLQEVADQVLPPFSGVDLAQLIRRYSGKHLPEETRASTDFRAMERQEYAAGQESVIFHAGVRGSQVVEDDFDEEEATRVFLREPPSRALPPSPPGPAVTPRVPEELRRTSDGSQGGDEGGGSGPSHLPPERQTSVKRKVGGGGILDRCSYLLRRHPHLVGGALSGFAVILLGISAWMVFSPGGERGDEIDSWHAAIADGAEREAVTEVTLNVSTSPANAELHLDGRFQGSTPVSLRDLEVGETYVLRFERSGYDPKELSVLVEPEMAPIVVQLDPLGGIVRVVSEPPGAEIFLDGDPQGEAPVTVMGLEREQTFEVEARFGEETQTEEVAWADGDERMKELNFAFEEPASEDGADESAQASARATGRRTTPRRSTTPRRQERPAREEAEESSGGSAPLNPWAIGQAAEQGRLNVRVQADQARIEVNGSTVREGNVLVGHSLEAGRYEVRVYFPTLKRYSETRVVEIRPGETSTVTIAP